MNPTRPDPAAFKAARTPKAEGRLLQVWILAVALALFWVLLR